MRHITASLALILIVLSCHETPSASALSFQWPYDLPRIERVHPEHDVHIKRHAEAQERLEREAPSGVRKMSDDLGQKFFLDYWDFGDGVGANKSTPIASRPIVSHSHHKRSLSRLLGRRFFARDFSCPTNTRSCSALGVSNACCSTGQDCVQTSEGVGCCQSGQACGDSILSCDVRVGYTPCVSGNVSGCCIPGASCGSGGCVLFGEETLTTTLPATEVTEGAELATETRSGKVVTVIVPSVDLSFQTVTATPSGSTTTETVVSMAATCESGFFSCPVSLGGGCCANGQICQSESRCGDETETAAEAPILVATDRDTTAYSTTTRAPASTPSAGCPTGYYMCSARYLGGCCRVGRDCQTTSCPPGATTTIVDGNDRVIAATSATGNCANGWSSCGPDGNGGCCPSGYNCGISSCSASGQRDTAKMAPNAGNPILWAWSFIVLGLVTAVGMVLL